jgi:hypothetical protein
MLIGQALLDVMASWLVAAGVILLIYLAVSVADFRDVFMETICLAVHATWLIPAILLISKRSPLPAAAGILLIANAVRLLFSGHIPQKGENRRPGASLRELQPWGILGAVTLQLGISALCLDHPFLAAGLIALTAWIWTSSSVATGLLPRRKKSTIRKSAFSIGVTVALTTILLAWQFRSEAGANSAPGIVEAVKSNATQAERKKANVTSVFAASDQLTRTVPEGVPGVILHPDPKPARALAVAPPSTTLRAPLANPVTFPFTGEYHLFPRALAAVPGDSLNVRGTPLDSRYKTFTEQPVETEAYQSLHPPFDFANCGVIRVTILSAEPTPGMANVQILAGGTWIDLGSSLFGFGVKLPAPEETLAFDVPLQAPRSFLASAIRIHFRRDPAQANRSAKVAVDRFELLPRTNPR